MPQGESTHPVNRDACRRVADKNPLLKAARHYTLALDLPVFPLAPGGKLPALPKAHPEDSKRQHECKARCAKDGHGLYDATTHELVVCQWWKDRPDANIGLPTGQRSGFLVLDVDPKNGGLESLAKLPKLPPTRMVRTPSGGFHYYFRWQSPLGNSPRDLGKGLDVRGEGGYVVAPPSSVDGNRYEWMNEDDPAELPAWLLERLLPPTPRPKNPVERRIVSMSELLADDPRRAKAASTLIGQASELPEGDRNKGTFRIAVALREVATTEEQSDDYIARMREVLPYGVGDNGGRPFTEAEAERTIASAEATAELGAWEPSSTLEVATNEELGGLSVTWGTDIDVKPLEWLWPNYVPLGTLGILAGAPKVGKSAVAVDIAARVTTGRPMPDGSEGVKGCVLMVAPEDGPDGARVRFEAAGGNLALFGLIGEDTPPSFPDDTAELEKTIRAHDVRLVVIDNLEAVAAHKVEMNKAKDVTEMLAPLQAVAKRTGASILAIEHTRKSWTPDPLDSVLGSRKITGIGRSVAFVLRDQDNPTERLFAVRGNYAAEDDGTLRFTLQSAGEDARGLKVVWQGSGNISLSAAMLAVSEPPNTALGEAKAFLREILGRGPVASGTVKAEAAEQEIAVVTLQRARVELGVTAETVKTDKGRGTYWVLPSAQGGSSHGRLMVATNETMIRPPLGSHYTSTTGGSSHPPSYETTPFVEGSLLVADEDAS
jgi:hypothetical protein